MRPGSMVASFLAAFGLAPSNLIRERGSEWKSDPARITAAEEKRKRRQERNLLNSVDCPVGREVK